MTDAIEDAVLEPYLEAISSECSESTIRAVVVKLLADSAVFAGYDQIKAAASVSLTDTSRSDGSNKLVTTLDLFSYGTIRDYFSDPNKYLALNETQLSKLRQLTVLSLAQTICQQRKNVFTYALIQEALQMSGDTKQQIRDAEGLLSQLVAANVLQGKLSQNKQAFLLQTVCCPRDVHPAEIVNMIQVVQRVRQKLTESDTYLTEQQLELLAAAEEEKAFVQEAQDKYRRDHNSSFDPMDLEGGGGGGGGPRLAAAAHRQKRSRGGLASNSIPDVSQTGASRPSGL